MGIFYAIHLTLEIMLRILCKFKLDHLIRDQNDEHIHTSTPTHHYIFTYVGGKMGSQMKVWFNYIIGQIGKNELNIL